MISSCVARVSVSLNEFGVCLPLMHTIHLLAWLFSKEMPSADDFSFFKFLSHMWPMRRCLRSNILFTKKAVSVSDFTSQLSL